MVTNIKIAWEGCQLEPVGKAVEGSFVFLMNL